MKPLFCIRFHAREIEIPKGLNVVVITPLQSWEYTVTAEPNVGLKIVGVDCKVLADHVEVVQALWALAFGAPEE